MSDGMKWLTICLTPIGLPNIFFIMKIRLLLVDHEFHPIGRRFSVETSDDDEISDLKKKVKEEKKATFSQ